MFRSDFKSGRCVIPASGFYEWTGPKGAKTPHYFSAPDGRPLAFAGLWERVTDLGVPKDHQLRGIDRHLDLEGIRAALKPFYSSTGRPSVDPELMIRMLLVGYCLGIRSERRLCEEVHLNLAYRWFCRVGLDGKVPDHSTFSKNRHCRFRESDIFRQLFESIVARCVAEGLVSANGFAVDASLIAADANKQRSVPSSDWNPDEIKDDACRAAREYLAMLDDAAFGAASPVTPKFIARSDPGAQWTGAHKGHAFFAYATNYLIDTDHGVIVDVEATRAIRQAEVGASRTMVERTEERFGLKPGYLVADTAYGSADNLAWLVKQKRITPYIPVFDKSTRTDGTFSRSDFTFDPEADCYICPAGKKLVQFRRAYATPRTGVGADGTRRYRASKKDCDVCELKARCCPNAVARKIPRDVEEDSRDVARALAGTPEFETACQRRKKGGDAVRPSQTHIATRALAATGSMWRKGRVPARRDRAKLATSRAVEAPRVRNGGISRTLWRRRRHHADERAVQC